MDRLKTFRKYIIWLIAFYIFTMLLTYIGLNSKYQNINSIGNVPDGVKINLSQATSVNGRVLGEVNSTEESNLNGKYLKVDIFSKTNKLIGTKYLKLEELKLNEPRKFAVYFSAENIKSFKVDVKDNTEEIEHDVIRVRDLYKKIFLDEDLKTSLIIALILYAMFT